MDNFVNFALGFAILIVAAAFAGTILAKFLGCL